VLLGLPEIERRNNMSEQNELFPEDQIEQTSDEKIAAVEKLKNNIQDEFIQIGQLLSEMKAK
jgi:uncharacterized membrane protein